MRLREMSRAGVIVRALPRFAAAAPCGGRVAWHPPRRIRVAMPDFRSACGGSPCRQPQLLAGAPLAGGRPGSDRPRARARLVACVTGRCCGYFTPPQRRIRGLPGRLLRFMLLQKDLTDHLRACFGFVGLTLITVCHPVMV